jgi:hypothetical protein
MPVLQQGHPPPSRGTRSHLRQVRLKSEVHWTAKAIRFLPPGHFWQTDPDGNVFKYFFWDAYYKGLLLACPEREARLQEELGEPELVANAMAGSTRAGGVKMAAAVAPAVEQVARRLKDVKAAR